MNDNELFMYWAEWEDVEREVDVNWIEESQFEQNAGAANVNINIVNKVDYDICIDDNTDYSVIC